MKTGINGEINELEVIMEGWPEPEEAPDTQIEEQEEEVVEETESEEESAEEGEVVEEQTEESTTEEEEEVSEESEESEEETEEKPEEDKDKEEEEPEEFTPNAELLELVAEEGKEFKTQEEFETHLTDKVQAMKKQTEEFNDISQKLNGIISKNGELGILIAKLGEGKDFLSAIVEAGIPDLIPEDGDFDSEDYKKLIEDRKNKLAENDRKKSDFQQKVDESQANITAYVEKNKLDANYEKAVYESIGQFVNGEVTENYLNILQKGLAYDQKVDELQKEVDKKIESARVEERNKKIIKNKVKKSKETDIPDVDSKTGKGKADKMSDVDKLAMQLNSNYL